MTLNRSISGQALPSGHPDMLLVSIPVLGESKLSKLILSCFTNNALLFA
jgi:hypothetical protein